METTWSPHERIANSRDESFLLTGLGAIRNRVYVLILPSAEIPVDWSLLGEDDGNQNNSGYRNPARAERNGEAAVRRYGQGCRRCGTGYYGDRRRTPFGRGGDSPRSGVCAKKLMGNQPLPGASGSGMGRVRFHDKCAPVRREPFPVRRKREDP